MESPSLATVLESPEVQAFATGFPTTLAHLAVTLGLLGAGGASAFSRWPSDRPIRAARTRV